VGFSGTIPSTILDALPAHVALIDPKGIIVAVNESWRRLSSESGPGGSHLDVGSNYLGETAAEGGGLFVDVPHAAEGIRDVLAGRTPQYVTEYPLQQAAGPSWFRMMVTPLRQEAITGAVVMHIDISERKVAEERLFQLNRLYAVLGRINEAITRVREPSSLYERACQIAVEAGGMVMAWVGEIDPETRRIRPLAKAGMDDGYLERVRFSVDDQVNTAGPFGTSMREGRVDVCNDIGADPRMATVRDAALARGYRSAAAVPVKSDGAPVAAFMFYSEAVGFFQEPEIRLLTTLGEDISFALESMRAEQERQQAEESLRESEERYRLLFQKNPHPMWVYDLETLRFLAVNDAAVDQYGYSSEEFLAMTIRDIRPDEDREPLERIVATLKDKWRSDSTWRHLKKDGSLIEVEISSDALAFKGHNARLVLANDVTERRRAERRTAAFSELGRKLNSATTPVEAGRIVVQIADELIGWEAATFNLTNEDGSRMVSQLNIDTVDGLKRPCPPHYMNTPASPLARRTILEGAQLILRDPKLLPDIGGIPFGNVSRPSASLLFVPVRDGSRVLGVLSVQSYQPNAYDQQDLDTLQALADYCGGAMNRIQAEAAMRDSQADMAAAQRIAQMGNWSVELPAIRINWSDEVCAIHGVAPGTSPTLEEGFAYIVEGSRDLALRRFEACQRDGTPFDEHLQIINTQGTRLWVRVIGEAKRDADGKIRRVQGALQDVTARKQAEQDLKASEERFRLVSRATNDAIWDWDVATDQLWWNDGFEALFGYRREGVEPTSESRTKRIHPADLERVLSGFHEVVDEGADLWSDQYRFLRRDGSYAVVLDRGHVIRDPDGRPVRVVGGMTDLTERLQAEARIAEQAALIDEARDAFVVRDIHHRIQFWSKGAERLYGWTADEAIGRSSQELLDIDPVKFMESDRIVQRDGEWSGELRKTGRNGDRFIVDSRSTLLRDAHQQPRSILTIDTDITEKKRTQAHFLRAQRMESIGTLAGGIAHDLNNVLAPILMSLELLKEKLREREDEEILTTLQTSAQRGADLVRQVLTFARGIEGQRVEVDLSGLTREIQNIVRDTFPKSVELRLVRPAGLWNVTGDPTQLHQVLLNLCVNARDAMPNGGLLTVALENTVLDESYVGMNPGAKLGAHVCVRIADNGTGIPPAVRERIFEPFFTTKDLGKGTGLGLSTTLAIVKSHGGFINLYSEPGRGTIFKIYLPANTDQAGSGTADPIRPQFPRGKGELILVVDDEEGIRKVAQKTLERFGYRVVTAQHGADALSVYAKHHGDVAAVLTDMAMPIMDGPALIVALKTMNPGAKIIASSGLNSGGGVAKAMDAGVEHFIPKPYTAEVLLKTLASLFAPGRGVDPS
jgi:PAS domain S-box-containing protein